MKAKTVIISLAVTGALVAGGIYGAYYVIQSRKSPVQVVPVTNVNSGYWGTTDTIYGTITSQVAQNVLLDEEYSVEEVFVEAGQEVKEGDPLFSYDMTLPELELELKELELQTYELEKTRLERDLERLRNGTYTTASLDYNDMGSMTASGEMDLIIEEPSGAGGGAGGTEGSGSGQGGLSIDSATVIPQSTEGTSQGNTEGSTETTGQTVPESTEETNPQTTGETVPDSQPGTETVPAEEGGIEIESVETVAGTVEGLTTEEETEGTTEETGESQEQTTMDTYVSSFLAYYSLLKEYEKDGMTDVFADALIGALNIRNTHLAEKKDRVIPLQESEAVVADYVLTEEALQSFQKAGTEDPQAYVEEMERMALTFFQTRNQELEGIGLENLSLEKINTLLSKSEALYKSLDGTKQQEAYSYVIYAIKILGSNIQQGGVNEKSKQAYTAYAILTDTAKSAVQEALKADAVLAAAWEKVEDLALGKSESEYEVTQYAELIDGELQVLSSQKFMPNETVFLSAEELDFYTFSEWRIVKTDGTEIEAGNASETSFVMPESDVSVYAKYLLDATSVESAVNQFLQAAETARSEEAMQSETYLEGLKDTINLYQTMLSELPAEIMDESGAMMEEYALKTEVMRCIDLERQEELEDSYKALCLAYVDALITGLDPQNLTREALEEAKDAYAKLGVSWGQEITSAYLLDAYEVILMIQEIDTSLEEDAVKAAVQAAADAYYLLPEEGKALVWNLDLLEQLMEEYGIQWPEETESEFGDDFGDFGDFGDLGMDEGSTSEEIQSMIKDTEREIAEKDRQIREAEIALGQSQRILDGKVVKSTLDGTVVSVGESDGTSEDEYFVKVASATGLYARGSMNELDLETIHVGDTISGMQMDTGLTFTAVIKEISEYPDVSGESMSYGSENTNASYYPFLALIDNAEELSEGDAELYLSDSVTDYSSIISLENYFVRTENDGRAYVYIQGEDGKLKKQYVELGQEYYGIVTEIRSGLEESDLIAFPYGDDVAEGADTVEVDSLMN